jgi:hypothetical protein
MKAVLKHHGKGETIAIAITAVLLALVLAGLWKLVLGRSPNDFEPQTKSIRAYTYELAINPEHPRAGDLLQFQVKISNRENGQPAANADFFVSLSEPQLEGWVKKAPDQISRDRRSTNEGGILSFEHRFDKPRKYLLTVVPAAGLDNPGMVREQEKQHPEYRGQPGGPSYYFFVE